jgi:hypothetical protein
MERRGGPTAGASGLALPGGRTIGVWLAGAVSAGLVVGVVAGLVRSPQPRTLAASPSIASSLEPTGAATVGGVAVTAAASAQADPTPSAPSAAPAVWVPAPWEDSTLELSNLKSVTRTSEGKTLITVDRLTFYTGAKAAEYYHKHPELEAAEYAVVNQNPRLYTFTLVPGTPILLGRMRSEGAAPTPPELSDAAHLASGFTRLKASGAEVYVWLNNDKKDNGWVTYVAEQYFP